jgi:hypothetical protein
MKGNVRILALRCFNITLIRAGGTVVHDGLLLVSTKPEWELLNYTDIMVLAYHFIYLPMLCIKNVFQE